MSDTRKDSPERSGSMPVPKSGRQTNGKKNDNSKSQENRSHHTGNQGPRTTPMNSNMDSHPGKDDSDNIPQESNNPTGVSGTTKLGGNGSGKGKGKVNGISGTNYGNKNDGRTGDGKVYNSVGKNRLKKSNANKSDGFRSNSFGNTTSNISEGNVKPVEPTGNAKKDFLQGNSQPNGFQGKHDVITNSRPTDLGFHEYVNPDLTITNAKLANAQSEDNAVIKKYSEEQLSFFQPDFEDEPKSPTVEELCAKWPSIEPKCDLESSNDEGLPTKDIQPQKSSSAQQDMQSGKTSVVQQSDNLPSVLNKVASNASLSPNSGPRFNVPKSAPTSNIPKSQPRFKKTNQKETSPIRSPVGRNGDMNQTIDNSSHSEHKSAGNQPTLNFYGSSGRSRHSEESGYTNGQHAPHYHNVPRFANRNHSNNFGTDGNYEGTRAKHDGMNPRNPNYLSQGRGQNGLQNAMNRGGQKKNKNGKKFNNQNGYQGDGKKHFGRSGTMQGQWSPIDQHSKTGPPLGYYNNQAYMGQHLVSAVPPLMSSQVNQREVISRMGVVQPEMMTPVGAMQPQVMNSAGPQMLGPVQFGDDQRQYTMAIFPNGYTGNQWIDVGNQPESQQYLVQQTSGEMVPLTMANMMPYVMPYTAGLPNTGVPMMIPAVGPPVGTGVTNVQAMNGQEFTNPSGNAHQMTTAVNTQLNNENYTNQNTHGTDMTYPTANQMISQSVFSHVGPILACSEEQNHFVETQLGKSRECGTPTQTLNGKTVVSAPNNVVWIQTHTQVNDDHMANDGAHCQNLASAAASSPTFPDRQTPTQNPAAPLYGTPSNVIVNTPDTTNGTPSGGSWNGTPGAWNVTPSTSAGTPGPSNVTPGPSNVTPGPLNVTPSTPEDAAKTGAKRQSNEVKMMSVSQLETMQRMSSANGKRVPMNARSKDSPNHMPQAPQEVQEELVKFICDSWNKVNQEYQKGSNGVAFHDSEPCPLEGFVPFDLEAYWGKRLVQNMTTQNIPTQNM